MTASTDAVKSVIIHALNISIVPFYSMNPNQAPLFYRVSGYRLPRITFTVYNESDPRNGNNSNETSSQFNYTLPVIYDPDYDDVWMDMRLGQAAIIIEKSDNATRNILFRPEAEMGPELVGEYQIVLVLQDNHWLGALSTTYVLPVSVVLAPLIESPQVI